jgi:hypothetical protein
LKLLREGKFFATPLSEVAFQANLSGTMMCHVYESRDELLEELSEHLTEQIVNAVEGALKNSQGQKERFFQSWMALYKYYTLYPDSIAFIEQFENIKANQNADKIVHPAKSKSLTALFKDESLPDQEETSESNQTLAYFFHANVLTAAKIRTSEKFTPGATPEVLSEILWNGMYVHLPEQKHYSL